MLEKSEMPKKGRNNADFSPLRSYLSMGSDDRM